MPQDRLDRKIINTQAVQVRCEAAPECVPTMPLGEHLVAFLFVLTVFTFGFFKPSFNVIVYIVNVPHTLADDA